MFSLNMFKNDYVLYRYETDIARYLDLLFVCIQMQNVLILFIN